MSQVKSRIEEYFEKVTAVKVAIECIDVEYNNKLEIVIPKVKANNIEDRYWIVEMHKPDANYIQSLKHGEKVDPKRYYEFGVVIVVDTETSNYVEVKDMEGERASTLQFAQWFDDQMLLIAQFNGKLIRYHFVPGPRQQHKGLLGKFKTISSCAFDSTRTFLAHISGGPQVTFLLEDHSMKTMRFTGALDIERIKAIYPHKDSEGKLLAVALVVDSFGNFNNSKLSKITIFTNDKEVEGDLSFFESFEIDISNVKGIKFIPSKENPKEVKLSISGWNNNETLWRGIQIIKNNN